MKKSLLTFLSLCAMVMMMSAPASYSADGPIRHVVSFRFKEGADPAKIKQVEQAFAALKGKVSQIESLEWGTNVSTEKHADGFTHIWLATFKTAPDRDAYLVHP